MTARRRRELKVSASDSDDVAAEYEAAFDEAVDAFRNANEMSATKIKMLVKIGKE